jgi:hypothetical protein
LKISQIEIFRFTTPPRSQDGVQVFRASDLTFTKLQKMDITQQVTQSEQQLLKELGITGIVVDPKTYTLDELERLLDPPTTDQQLQEEHESEVDPEVVEEDNRKQFDGSCVHHQ